jgi:predicted dienelactone hydrolase
LIVAVLIACRGADPDPTPPAADEPWSPDELVAVGPHSVGYRSLEITWSDDLLTQGAPRPLRVSVWYPSSDNQGQAAVYQDLFPDDDAWSGAAVTPGAHPVAVFSHGHQAYGEASSFLTEHLASHGWVVFAPDHTGNLVWDGDERTTEIYLQRPLDLSATLDWIDAPPADDLLASSLGPERLLIGHSFGGYSAEASLGATFNEAAISACPDGSPFCSTMTEALAARLRAGFFDARWQSAISMAPGDLRLLDGGLDQLDVPLLLMTGGLDGSPGLGADPTWLALGHPDDRHVFLPAGGHNAFTDFAGALDPDGVVEPELGWAAVRGWALAWAKAMVEGDARATSLLDTEPTFGDPGVATTQRR